MEQLLVSGGNACFLTFTQLVYLNWILCFISLCGFIFKKPECEEMPLVGGVTAFYFFACFCLFFYYIFYRSQNSGFTISYRRTGLILNVKKSLN